MTSIDPNISPPFDWLEVARHIALREASVVATGDRLAWLAGTVLRVPVSMVTWIDDGRPVIMSGVGLPDGTVRESPLSDGLARHLTLPNRSIIVEDTSTHASPDEAAAVRGLGCESYTGVPLRARDGGVVGSFGVADRRPRVWRTLDFALLAEFGDSLVREVTLRVAMKQLEAEVAARRHTEAALFESETRYSDVVGHDDLTGLPNRMLLYDRLRQILARARRYEEVVAILHVAVDNLADINDTAGREVGDLVLQRIATRLALGTRESDTVARLGGDDFAVILPQVGSAENAHMVAQKIIDGIESGIRAEGEVPSAHARAGIALYPDDGTDAATLLHLAEAALQRARLQGKHVFGFQTDGGPRAASTRGVSTS